MKFIDETLELEERMNKYKQERMNALTAETASNPIVYRLLTVATLTNLKGPDQEQEHKRV